MIFKYGLVLVSAVCFLVGATPANRDSDVETTPNIIEENGFVSETHHVITDDGYILEMHRIPFGREGATAGRRPPVFIMHGLLGASNNFISIGADNSIAFNLADAGFDVWLGNARGTRDSRFHVSLDPDGPEDKFTFWDFSWHEIGVYDLASMTDYVRAYTNFEKLHYIGHSQGGTTFLVLNSIRPEYNDKFATANLLAPASYKQNFPNAYLRASSYMTDIIYSTAVSTGNVEISENLVSIFLRNEASQTDVFSNIISEVKKGLRDSRGILDQDMLRFLGGASMKQLAHYGQNVRSRTFRQWDYGFLRNRQVYGTLTPPAYDVTKINIGTIIYYSDGDELVGPEDVVELTNNLPNASTVRINDKDFSHLGFIIDPTVKKLVTDDLISRLNAYEELQS